MDNTRIIELANKGLITQIETVEKLAALSEAELVEKGYITQTGIFDAVDETEEEVPVMDEPSPAVVADDEEPEVEPEVIDDDEPVVDEGEEE